VKILTAAFALTLLLAGCTGGSDESSGDVSRDYSREKVKAQAEAQASQRAAAEKTLEDKVRDSAGNIVKIVIKDGAVTPRGGRVEVKAGEKVTLEISSDAEEEIHVHSDPEHAYEVGPGDSVIKTFTLDTPGQVAIEAHHLDATIVQLVVRP
jgi:hypothetical protein